MTSSSPRSSTFAEPLAAVCAPAACSEMTMGCRSPVRSYRAIAAVEARQPDDELVAQKLHFRRAIGSSLRARGLQRDDEGLSVTGRRGVQSVDVGRGGDAG